jgi:hypothetical protein
MVYGPSFYRLFHDLPTLHIFFKHRARGRELDLHFDLLEATPAAQQSLADVIDFAVIFVFDAEVVVQIHAAFDDLAAAIAFDMECVIALLRFGGCTAEKVFEEGHNVSLLFLLRWLSNLMCIEIAGSLLLFVYQSKTFAHQRHIFRKLFAYLLECTREEISMCFPPIFQR